MQKIYDALVYPVCMYGAMKCPPEDVGGVRGFEEMLDVLRNPQDPEYESYVEWLDGGFHSEEFDIEAVNRKLKEKNYGMEDDED